MFILLTKYQPTGMLRPKTTTKKFTRHTVNDKNKAWSLEAAVIPQRVKVQHIKTIPNVLADLVSRFKAVGFLWHWLKRPIAGVQYTVWALTSCWTSNSYAIREDWGFHWTRHWKANSNLWHITWLILCTE